MSLRFLGAGLVLLVLVLAGGCHSQSRYGANYCQPGVVAASPGCNPCNTCGTPPAPGTVSAAPGFGH